MQQCFNQYVYFLRQTEKLSEYERQDININIKYNFETMCRNLSTSSISDAVSITLLSSLISSITLLLLA